MSGGTIFKRFLAYFIDFLIIMLVTSAISYLTFLNPRYDKYEKYAEQYNELMDKYVDGDIKIEEYSSQVNDLSYDLNKNGYVYIIADIVVTFLYFGVFQYVTDGQTLGKKILSLKVVSNSDKKLKIYNYFIRCFILNGVIVNIFNFIGIWFSRSVYQTLNTIGGDIDLILSMIISLMILFYKDGRGLHDVLAGTKVIDLKLNKAVDNVKVLEEDN